MKRTGKFYRKNEAEVMKAIGLEPTPNSGSGWITKEDGQSDEVICQLKSTDNSRISVQKQDLDKLEYNAHVAHKIPVFAIQFLQSDETYLVLRPENLKLLAEYIQTGEVQDLDLGIDVDISGDDEEVIPKRIIKSNSNAREDFHKQREAEFNKRK